MNQQCPALHVYSTVRNATPYAARSSQNTGALEDQSWRSQRLKIKYAERKIKFLGSFVRQALNTTGGLVAQQVYVESKDFKVAVPGSFVVPQH